MVLSLVKCYFCLSEQLLVGGIWSFLKFLIMISALLKMLAGWQRACLTRGALFKVVLTISCDGVRTCYPQTGPGRAARSRGSSLRGRSGKLHPPHPPKNRL